MPCADPDGRVLVIEMSITGLTSFVLVFYQECPPHQEDRQILPAAQIKETAQGAYLFQDLMKTGCIYLDLLWCSLPSPETPLPCCRHQHSCASVLQYRDTYFLIGSAWVSFLRASSGLHEQSFL